MSTIELVLLHSPLVGSGFWRPVAQVLESRGWCCRLPTAAGHDGEVVAWRDWSSATSAAMSITPGAVVGHSTAGFLLPSLARMLKARGVVFVDALIPPDSGSVAPADSEFLQFVRSLPSDNGLYGFGFAYGPEQVVRRAQTSSKLLFAGVATFYEAAGSRDQREAAAAHVLFGGRRVFRGAIDRGGLGTRKALLGPWSGATNGPRS